MHSNENRSVRRALALALACLMAGFLADARVLAADVSAAVSWYDTLGFPNAKELPYVRVATGLYMIRGNHPPENRFTEGFLTSEDAEGFSVFLCSVSDFQDRVGMDEPYPPLTTIHFVRKTDGPVHKQVKYEVLDFQKVVTDVMARVHDIQSGPKEFRDREKLFAGRYPGLRPEYSFSWGRPVTHRARIFSFARACQQKGLAEVATELFDVAANIRDEQTGKVDPAILREMLQQQMGEAVLTQTEEQIGRPSIPLAELLKTYAAFRACFPASKRVSYAQEAADLLRKMIAEEAEHHPKPLSEMSPAEQVAENIYQLRNMTGIMWIMNQHYPVWTDKREGKDGLTPIHRLVDLGNVAVPQLIEALDDRRFTRSMEQQFNGLAEPRVMRVSDVAQRILEHLSGTNLWSRKSDDGKSANGGTRKLAEAWWKEVQGKGEKQTMIENVSAGKGEGLRAVRQLVEKYPSDALPAIEAALRVTSEPGYRGEYVEAAGLLPGDIALAFLHAQLAPEHDVYSQVYAAEALFRRGDAAAVPAIIEAWRRIQPRLPRNEGDAFSQVGRIIGFLAMSGDARAIDALSEEAKSAPVQVRYAVVEVFRTGSFNGGGTGRQVSLYDHVEKLPGGEAGAAIERLLVTALEDTERCFGPEGNLEKVSFADPRVCDMAAYVLSTRWPEKYAFEWTPSAAKCDPQIAKMRDAWRVAHGLPPLPSAPSAAVIPAAAESEVAPLLDAYLAAGSDADREAVVTRTVEAFGLRALPVAQARLSKDAPLRPLVLRLASIVGEVQVTTDSGGLAEKSGVTSLRGKVLRGEDLDQLAHRLEAEMPVDVAVVTFTADRTESGAGFHVSIGWLPGKVDLHAGWSREMAVRLGDKTVYRDAHWAAERGMVAKGIFKKMAEEFDKATQAGADAPVMVRFRLQRGPADR